MPAEHDCDSMLTRLSTVRLHGQPFPIHSKVGRAPIGLLSSVRDDLPPTMLIGVLAIQASCWGYSHDGPNVRESCTPTQGPMQDRALGEFGNSIWSSTLYSALGMLHATGYSKA
jgi:hypothetical protein